MMTIIGYGVTSGRGWFSYDANKDDAVLHWDRDADAELVERIRTKIDHVVGNGNGHLIDTSAIDPTTYHPLGGALMGSACDTFGRVHGHRGLYVTDGALVPGSAGACNPSMTITALAERSMETITREDLGTVF